MAIKICKKCKQEFEASFTNFYKHTASRDGFTPRCKSCVNEDNKIQFEKVKAADPELVKSQQLARTKKSYHKDIEKSRRYQREYSAKNRTSPDKRAKINMGKRGGSARLTEKQFQELLKSQNYRCAICLTDDPPKRGTHIDGWNIDHCHRTGTVRFILCGPCNRGLGAFCDDPIRIERAAKLLKFQQDAENYPPYIKMIIKLFNL